MIIGKFVKEKDYRFLCLVDIANKQEECYVSNSSKLKNPININKKTVLFVPNKGKQLRTKYTLHAVKVDNVWMILNLNYVNDLIQDFLLKKNNKDTLFRKHYIKSYKADFYIHQQKIIVEATKGILANKKEDVFPFVSCGRTKRQLKEILSLLNQSYKVKYYFIIINPHICTIQLNNKEKDSVVLKKCISVGMKIKYYKTKFYNGKCSLKEVRNKDILIT